ncbi:hypothetical protein ROP_53760 [Rhodococcus opacus B4]|uniref:Uncharacterized protein n=1 Tax=Rhodococcus opacus (strain B4) TaxID=632772 RepID=C1AVD3_RHOOB|nr:hypothetical protein ROP_53760 [Rhodococcus opacus B4]
MSWWAESTARTLITELRSLLGTKLVAYLAEAPDTSTVHGWVDGTSTLPDHTILNRLQVALDAARRIGIRDNAFGAKLHNSSLNVLARRYVSLWSGTRPAYRLVQSAGEVNFSGSVRRAADR